VGCPTPTLGLPCNDGGSPSLGIGTGETAFIALHGELPELELIHGPQGGYHLLLGFEADNLDGNHFISIEATGSIDGEVKATADRWTSLSCNTERQKLEGFNFFLIYDGYPEDLHDQVTAIEVTMRDNDGRQASAELTARIVDPVFE
jgi:hypothetical protein